MLFLMWELDCRNVFQHIEIFSVMLFVLNAKATYIFKVICKIRAFSYILLSFYYILL